MPLADLLSRWTPDSIGQFLTLLMDAVVCLGTAVVCGYIVGRERSAAKAPVGVRTHVLICVGAAAFVHLGMVANIYAFDRADPDFARLIQSIATGIGFLGAGAIFKSGGSVRGVSTATSIWLMGAAGAAAGCGAVAFALLITLIAFAVLRWSGEPIGLDDMVDEMRELFFEDLKSTLLGKSGGPGVSEAGAGSHTPPGATPADGSERTPDDGSGGRPS